MKTVKIIIVAILAIVITSTVYSQSATTKTETIKVWGNCDMCKAHIEKAAKTESVSKASWNKDSKLLTLVYDPSKIKSDDIQKKIAAVGYDTEKFKGDDKAYAKLDACCQYDRKK